MLLHTFQNGDQLTRKKKGVIMTFEGFRNILSTSVLNGGFQDQLDYIFNFDEKPDDSELCTMEEESYEEHLENIAWDCLEINPQMSTGLSTAADMDNLVIAEESYTLSNGFPLTVTAAVTGGIDKNGARPGDPACWEEIDSQYTSYIPGTINIILHINADLSKGAMVRSIMTASEAKAAAVGELLCPSLYSDGLATGSGTDGMILVCDPSTDFTLTAAGKDSKLGEMISKSVMNALKKAIGLQTDVTPEFQHHVIKRLERFGVSEESLYSIYSNSSFAQFLAGKDTLTKEAFLEKAEPLLKSGYWTGKASFLAHLLDQLAWKMLTMEDARDLCTVLFSTKVPKEQALSKELLIHIFCSELVSIISTTI